MKRLTETKMEKIVRIGFCRIDQIIEKACCELEEVKTKHKLLDAERLNLAARGLITSGMLSSQAQAVCDAQNGIRAAGRQQALGACNFNRLNGIGGQVFGGLLGS